MAAPQMADDKYKSSDDEGKVIEAEFNASYEETTPLTDNGCIVNLPETDNDSKRTIVLDEVVPEQSHIDCEDNDEISDKPKLYWSMDVFTSKFRGKNSDDKKLPRRVRRYYKHQDKLIRTYRNSVSEQDESVDDATKFKRTADILAKVTLALNVVLLLAKLAAAILSNSLSVISSLVDSVVDLISGVVIWYTGRAMRNQNLYSYPIGRTRLEPVSIMILSAIMSVASVQMIGQSIQTIVSMSSLPGQEGAPIMDIPTIVILVFTVVSKLIMFIVCRKYKTPMTDTLAQDHRNDVLSNIVALACGFIGYKVWKYTDPIGAIIISIYIFITWWATGLQQIKMLTGYTARPDFLKQVTWLCLNHHKQIRYIDTVRAFHFGTNFLVEVDIILPEGMSLKEAHDIGEPLQQKIEELPNVERCFVHLDYEFEHDPTKEHKIV